MKTFKELEAEYRRVPVRVNEGGQQASGYLALDGPNTEAVLASRELLVKKPESNGWFDLTLKLDGVRRVLLHNCVSRGHTRRGMRKSSSHEESIFPNVVVLDAHNLPTSAKVKSVQFKQTRQNYFFYHQIIEHQSVHRASQITLDALQGLRDSAHAAHGSEFTRKYDRFAPADLYLVHELYQICKFVVGDATYSVGWEMKSSGPINHGLTIKADAVATVTFLRSVPIDHALEHVWSWEHFFNQLAMEELPVDSLAFSRGKTSLSAGVYLPHALAKGAYAGHLHPGDLPLNRYEDRAALADCMRTWLSREGQRKQFRIGVNRVVENMASLVSLDQVMNLCSALESLTEFDQTSTVTTQEIVDLAGAAASYAKENNIKAAPDRIKGVLELLQHTSLNKRMKLLGQAVVTHVSIKDSNLIFDSVRYLRQTVAHGGLAAEFAMPSVAPTIQGFASLLVLYDLVTSGVPTVAASGSRIIALRRLDEAVMWLRNAKIKMPN